MVEDNLQNTQVMPTILHIHIAVLGIMDQHHITAEVNT